MSKRKRFVTDFVINQPDEFVKFILEDFFSKEDFKYTEFKGEYVWKKGIGFLAAPQFIKVDYGNGKIHIEAWLKGVLGGEMGLTGAYALIPKKMLKDTVDSLIRLLQQPVSHPENSTGANQGQAVSPSGLEGNTSSKQSIPVATHDPTSKATLALVMGVLSIVGLAIPLLGVIFGVAGINAAKQGMKSSAKGKATAGMVLSILFLVISIINWILGIFLNAMVI